MRPTPRSIPTPETPRCCVRQFPTMNPKTVELCAFDTHGRMRYRVELPADEDLASWHVFLLRRIRRLDPDAWPVLRLLG